MPGTAHYWPSSGPLSLSAIALGQSCSFVFTERAAACGCRFRRSERWWRQHPG